DKPSALLNTNGFFQPLLALVRHTIDLGFAAPEHASLCVVDEDADRLLDAISAWTPPPFGSRALDRREVA
ncbi:MAG TPA: LOG family protein, partial [Labilithrix sp.]|nr:LOG family protein [Labilithrix sp.]